MIPSRMNPLGRDRKSDWFEFDIEITQDATQVYFTGTTVSCGKDTEIDWGDGEWYKGIQSTYSKTYDAGMWTMRLRGDFSSISFLHLNNNSTAIAHEVRVNWDALGENLTSGYFMFTDFESATFTNLTYFPDNITTGRSMFWQCYKATLDNITSLPSDLESGYLMFFYCYSWDLNLDTFCIGVTFPNCININSIFRAAWLVHGDATAFMHRVFPKSDPTNALYDPTFNYINAFTATACTNIPPN